MVNVCYDEVMDELKSIAVNGESGHFNAITVHYSIGFVKENSVFYR